MHLHQYVVCTAATALRVHNGVTYVLPSSKGVVEQEISPPPSF